MVRERDKRDVFKGILVAFLLSQLREASVVIPGDVRFRMSIVPVRLLYTPVRSGREVKTVPAPEVRLYGCVTFRSVQTLISVVWETKVDTHQDASELYLGLLGRD